MITKQQQREAITKVLVRLMDDLSAYGEYVLKFEAGNITMTYFTQGIKPGAVTNSTELILTKFECGVETIKVGDGAPDKEPH